ncbi:hypothetical protein UFOVP765_52 [uncultured Caudovirales phage]|jgi:hypothetical protein|uniref:Uncharacterized protein n=1 Tax=uncultured Caudovirales phage TaxID=2100421 RepID=A0A6J5NP22_9CAUD|nr:hypothetical protein UFOVP765_52 [uncultured Caudovirales phage]
MDDELEPKKVKKPLKGLQKLYEDPMQDDDDIKEFKHDHGIGERYDE